MDKETKRREKVLSKERKAVEQQEKMLKKAALKADGVTWKEQLQDRLPVKVYTGLESAFRKGFSLVFQKGKVVIEKSYNRKNLQDDYAVRDYAMQIKGGRKELRQMHKSAGKKDFLNLTATTAEGIGLGALGIGMPDVVLFLSTLLKGIYETALSYGFDYESTRDQLIILKMMETSLLTGEDWVRADEEVDRLMLLTDVMITDEEYQLQMKRTASVFAMDMLLLKFIQGIPVVGILGGASNAVYYSKILRYVKLKYRKHYLLRMERRKDGV